MASAPLRGRDPVSAAPDLDQPYGRIREATAPAAIPAASIAMRGDAIPAGAGLAAGAAASLPPTDSAEPLPPARGRGSVSRRTARDLEDELRAKAIAENDHVALSWWRSVDEYRAARGRGGAE